MSEATFRGGVHPYEGKELSKDLPIKTVLPKGELVFSMAQHIGAPAKPVVQKGDKVLVGQKIGEVGGFISANICSSVSGTVKAVEPRMMLNGSSVTCVVIENDGEYTGIEGLGESRDYTRLSNDEIRAIVKEAGIVGMGGAGFPTNVKLAPKEPDKIDYILVNGAECEPYLTSDYRQMLECPEEIVGGLKVMLKLFDKAKGLICIEDNKPDAIAKMKEAVAGESRIEVKELKTKYPQGGERTLISAATGRKIYSAKLPADAGCIVDNIATVIAIYRAVCKQTPLITRVMTLTGDAFSQPVNVNVRLGISHAELVEEGGGFATEPAKIISGGPMMGFAMFDLNVPVTKTSSSLLALTKDEVAENEPSPCIRCGRCVSACPGNLVPQKMAQAAMNNDYDTFVKLNGMECYECGSCTFVCPAKRPLTQTFKQARQYVAAQRRKS
ncbi:MAG: electron transport complex subunit RsxC [Lachnospiraceae bacterium]|nr:electron transport complex subunit RsxC [Lachnospiraceae bacterium]